MRKLILEEIEFVETIIQNTKDTDYINLLARKRKARLQVYLMKEERRFK